MFWSELSIENGICTLWLCALPLLQNWYELLKPEHHLGDDNAKENKLLFNVCGFGSARNSGSILSIQSLKPCCHAFAMWPMSNCLRESLKESDLPFLLAPVQTIAPTSKLLKIVKPLEMSTPIHKMTCIYIYFEIKKFLTLN